MTSRLRALAYALGVFSLLYPLTNLYADHLSQQNPLPNVTNFSLIDIPFIDWMIVPYACSLPLFVAGFFIVQSYKQLQCLTHRLLIMTLLGCLCFYWLPFTFDIVNYNVVTSLQNTSASGYQSTYQWFYHVLHIFDKPYNQLPSLHVSYALLLLLTLWHLLNSQLNKAILVTLCLLIIISTLFTWQHHLPDVIAGIVVAWLVWAIDHYLDKQHGSKKGSEQSTTKASIVKYLVIAVTGFLLIQIVPVLLWKKTFINMIIGYYWLISFSILAIAYHLHKPEIFVKKDNINQGKHKIISHLLFAPIIIIYWLMWSAARKMGLVRMPTVQSTIEIKNGIDIIATGKFTSSTIKNIETISQPILSQYQHIIYLDVGCEIGSSFSTVKNILSKNGVNCHYINTPMLDITAWNNQEYDTIKNYCEQVEIILSTVQKTSLDEYLLDTPVLIITQCVMGWSRSVAMLGCILAYFGHSPKQIREHISIKYPRSHLDSILDNELFQCLSSKHLSCTNH